MASTTTGIYELLTGSSTPFLASGDCVCFVDISDTSQAPQGSLVKGTLTQFFAAVPVPVNITSTSAVSLAVGRQGSTQPAFAVDSSTALQVAGLKVTGAVAGGTVAIATTDSGAANNLTINALGAGTIGIGSVSTGRVTITPVTTITGALTLSSALTYGGVTLSNAVTGAGNMVLSASPTFTGTAAFATVTTSGTINGQTISSSANFTSNVTINNALAVTNAAVVGNVKVNAANTGTGGIGSQLVAYFSSGTAVLSSVGANTSTNGKLTIQQVRSDETSAQTILATDASGNITTLAPLTGGLTVSSGTSVLQAVTATTGAFSSTLSAVGSMTVTASASRAQLFLTGGNPWKVDANPDGNLYVTYNAALDVLKLTSTGAVTVAASSGSDPKIIVGTGVASSNAYLQLNAGSGGSAYINSIGSGSLILGANGAASNAISIATSSYVTFAAGATFNGRTDDTGSVLQNLFADNAGRSIGFTSEATRTNVSTHMRFSNPNGVVGSIQTSGSSTAFNTSSDRRLKTSLGIASDISSLKALEIHRFTWNADGSESWGVMAQDAYKVAPWAVTPGSDKRDDNGRLIQPWSVDYSRFVPDLIVGWQNHESRLARIEKQLQLS